MIECFLKGKKVFELLDGEIKVARKLLFAKEIDKINSVFGIPEKASKNTVTTLPQPEPIQGHIEILDNPHIDTPSNFFERFFKRKKD